MKNERSINNISDDLKKKLAACKSAGEAKKILADAGIKALDDEVLDKVTGGEMLSLSQLFAEMEAETQARQSAALQGQTQPAGTPQTAPSEAEQEYLKGLLKPSERPYHS